MNAETQITTETSEDRPVYGGLDWTQSRGKASLWRAASGTTDITYAVEEVEDGRWSARQGFPNLPGRPNAVIGCFASRDIGMTACERHDYRFWSAEATRAGKTTVFMGSPDHVSAFVDGLPDYERDDLLDMIAGGYQLPDGSNFTNVASFFPARKAGLKQERSGDYTATFTVAAKDLPLWLMQTAPGAGVVLGAAEIDASSEDEWKERAARALGRSFALVQDNDFHAWFAQKYDRWGLIGSALQQTSEEVERAVSETLRRIIGCPTRRDLVRNRDAVVRLEKIDREFYLDMSRGFAVTGP